MQPLPVPEIRTSTPVRMTKKLFVTICEPMVHFLRTWGFFFLSLLLVLWEFHPMHFDHSTPLFTPGPSHLPCPVLFVSLCFKKPIKHSWCCLYIVDCVTFHSSIGGLGRASPLKKTCSPFPVATSYPLARAGPARPPPVSMLGFCLASPYTGLLHELWDFPCILCACYICQLYDRTQRLRNTQLKCEGCINM